MPTKVINGKTFDARPDRVDFRDFPYRPPLRSLLNSFPDPDTLEAHLSDYIADGMVLNQGKHGACTGFGLAAVINYLNWERGRDKRAAQPQPKKKWKAPEKVSESMLYLNARLYDEWEGEDYEGSSCRGAMKGWHKHGVCSKLVWPYTKGKPGRPVDPIKWREEAGKTVLGSYYRLNAKSLVEMQAAIHEVHAIYVAADVGYGWTNLKKKKNWQDARIGTPKGKDDKGGHAFALVGYTPEGFIVQNSWGPDWGYNGFALLPYKVWIEDGYDAWVLALGAPIGGIESPVGQSRLSLQERTRGPAGWSIFGGGNKEPKLPETVAKWDDDDASEHTILSTIDGAPVRHLQDTLSAEESVREVVRRALKKAGAEAKEIAVYVHGGLNGKDDGLLRAGFMGPWFAANGIIPIFPIWQTDATTSILHALAESLGLDDLVKEISAKGPTAKPDERALDRHIEDFARRSPGRPAWGEMRNKAGGLCEAGGALRFLFDEIAKSGPGKTVHLIGHSAGAIVVGHALSAMKSLGLKLGTVSLYAPACTAGFANATFGKSADGGYLKKGSLFIDYLSDRRERADACVKKFGITFYSKSLLYLVSRAFEDKHKTPILGLEWTLNRSRDDIIRDDVFSDKKLINDVVKWQSIAKSLEVDSKKWDIDKIVVTKGDTPKKDVTSDNVHGAFDNNVDCVAATIRRIKGTVKVPVTDLDFGGG